MEKHDWKELYEAVVRHNERLERRLTDKEEFWTAIGQTVSTLMLQYVDAIETQWRLRVAIQSRLLGLLPAITNSIFGREIFPLAVEDSALLETIFEHVSEEEIRLFAQSIGDGGPELAGLLMHRWRRHKEKRAKTETELRDAAGVATGNNAEDDAAGGPSQAN